MNRVFGADLSHWDGTVEWALWDHTYKFVFMKVSEGSPGAYWCYKDDLAGQHWEGAGQEGLYRSPYHFWRYDGGTPKAQAEYFYKCWKEACEQFGNDVKLELPPVADFEDQSAPKFDADVRYKFRAFLDEVERVFKVKPIVYTAKWYTSSWVGDCSWLSGYILWVAQYTYNMNGYPSLLPTGMPAWRFWQYTDKAEIPGVAENDEDLDCFNGTEDELRALLVGAPVVPVPSFPYRAVVAADTLNIRSGPGLSSPKIVPLKNGDVVNIYEISNEWGRITDAPTDRWISVKWTRKL